MRTRDDVNNVVQPSWGCLNSVSDVSDMMLTESCCSQLDEQQELAVLLKLCVDCIWTASGHYDKGGTTAAGE
jgi:hypothetical protein